MGYDDVMPAPTRPLAGRYRLDAEVGRGGMGVVWKGFDELLHRTIAVKELHFPPDIDDVERERLARRTLREARAVAAVDDDHAVRVFDVVEQDDRPWIVMEYVDGATLTDIIRARGALPVDEVARIGVELAQALAAAHEAGVLHRDVKPSNVLVRADGRVALTDFGIAVVDSDDSDGTTSSGVLIGSPAFMSPERAQGAVPGPASDIWSLGATLWTAAEGVPPYQRPTSIATLAAVISDDPPPCRVCDRALSDLLLRMMAKEPAARPTYDELRQRFAALAATPTAGTVAFDPYPTEVLEGGFDRTIALDTRQRMAAVETPAAERPTPPPALPPAFAPAPPPTVTGRRRRSLLLAVAVVALLSVTAIVAALMVSGGDTSRGKSTSRRAAPPSASASASASASGRAAGSNGAGTGSGPGIPDGWQRYTDPSVGWSVAVPQGWQVERNGTETDFNDPSGDRYLRVDTRYPPGPSAKGAWEDQEKAFQSSHDGYRRIALDNVDYRGYDAADWEFTYRAGGVTLHALDRGLVANGRGYAMYFQTHEGRWDDSKDVMHQIWDTFRPAS